MVARSHQWKQGDHLVAWPEAVRGAAAAFEGGDAFLQHRHRVGQAAVDIAEGLQLNSEAAWSASSKT